MQHVARCRPLRRVVIGRCGRCFPTVSRLCAAGRSGGLVIHFHRHPTVSRARHHAARPGGGQTGRGAAHPISSFQHKQPTFELGDDRQDLLTSSHHRHPTSHVFASGGKFWLDPDLPALDPQLQSHGRPTSHAALVFLHWPRLHDSYHSARRLVGLLAVAPPVK